MSLYPTLEDMKVDHYIQQRVADSFNQPAQPQLLYNTNNNINYGYNLTQQQQNADLYPRLVEYMGLNITPEMLNQQNELALAPANNQVHYTSSGNQMLVAPVTGLNNAGVLRSDVKQGIRQVVLCKDAKGFIGLKVKSVNKGIFICFVESNSPAAMVGLRFGDQIIQINDELVAGWDTDKTMKFLKKAAPEKITMAIRDRPFERTITMHKDSSGTVGFIFNENKITSIVKDSSAARNGLLIDHHMVEVNGQNVIGMKDKEIKDIFEKAERTITITILPSFIYEHIMKSIGWSLVSKRMDHSIPDV
ncbi:hypothetical protein HELRODRAFT_69589 [Helobdella robusta]|uniref:PDZ domain-containing protein n=1 Tax=Helobdella robusta TaxID=6412 RepID=T1FZW9_HELRO|nr:hypothetical protein HELRODRAFT_69589 [Helobdella robusta]ESN92587.1 hypothetical protein HELRODRAFT_69589 [Helobdella robusta]